MMKSKITLLTAMMFALVFFACSGDENKIYLKIPVNYHGKNYTGGFGFARTRTQRRKR